MELYKQHFTLKRNNIFRSTSTALEPPEEIEIAKWSEDNLSLSPRVSRFSGPINFSLTPYLREPLNAIKKSKRVVCIFGAQVGKTLMLQCLLGYHIDQNPQPTMIVYPTQAICKRRSKKHIQPFIIDNSSLKKHTTGLKDDMQLFEYTLDRMDVAMAWAGSESTLASEPIALLLRDEICKYDDGSLTNSEARTTSYDMMARIFDVSTPKSVNDPGYIDFVNGTQEQYNVPCPKCGKMQVLKFAQIKFPKQNDSEEFANYTARVRQSAYYECVECKAQITDKDKIQMIQSGKWVIKNTEASYRSFQMSSWYAVWVKFGSVAADFLTAKDNTEDLMNWINNKAAEFWEERGENTDDDKILKHKIDYDRNFIPVNDPVIILLTVDVQKDYIVYEKRAHSLKASYLLDYGTASVLEDIPSLMDVKICNPAGQEYYCAYALLDTGYRTVECYEFALHTPNVIPVKGNPSKQRAPLTWQKINKYPGSDRSLPGIVSLMHIDTIFFKEQLLHHFSKGIDEEGKFNPDAADWFLHGDTKRDYTKQLTAEVVVEEIDRKGRIKREWKQVSKANHYLDTTVYQLAGRFLIRDMLSKITQEASTNEEYYEQKPPEGW